jgi:hypothetical protein
MIYYLDIFLNKKYFYYHKNPNHKRFGQVKPSKMLRDIHAVKYKAFLGLLFSRQKETRTIIHSLVDVE